MDRIGRRQWLRSAAVAPWMLWTWESQAGEDPVLLAPNPFPGEKPLEPRDFTPQGLLRVQRVLLAPYQGSHLRLPLELKARYSLWELVRYHLTPWNQVHHYVELPDQIGKLPRWIPGSDSSTWNGALLAALGYKLAVTRDRSTQQLIERLLEGMKLFLTVTRSPGLLARNVSDHPAPEQPGQRVYEAEDGQRYWYREDAAKGTYNQAAAGLGTLLMVAADQLSLPARRSAQWCLQQLALHLVRHDYHITDSSGKRTPYGNLTPLVGSQGVPFNAQVAYMIVALGHHFRLPNLKPLRLWPNNSTDSATSTTPTMSPPGGA